MYTELFIDYNQYIKSDRWKRKRQLKLKQVGHKCQRCKSEDNLNVHHSVYARLGGEKNKDLFVLCRSCHFLYHSIHKKPTKGTTKMFVKRTARKWDKLTTKTN